MTLIFTLMLGIIAVIWVRNVLFGSALKMFPEKLREMPATLPKVSVIIPCYSEKRGVYLTLEALSKVDYPPELLEIVVVDDKSPDAETREWIDRGIAENPHMNMRCHVQEMNQGKQAALITGFNMTSGEIIVLLDSDVQVTPDVIKGFVRELQDPTLGVVGAMCGVSDVNRDLISQAYASVFYTLHEWLKNIESRVGVIAVVDGKAMGYRREIYGQMIPHISHRTWLGLHMQAGEDRFITHLLTLKGFRSKMIPERVNTSAPVGLVDLYKQQLRWRRSGMIDLFWTIGDLPNHVRTIGPIKTVWITFYQMTYLLLPFMYLTIVYMYGLFGLLAAQTAFLGFAMFLKIVMNFHAWFFNRDQYINNPILTSIALTCWMSVDLFITTPLALLTMDEGGWGTRNLATTSSANQS